MPKKSTWQRDHPQCAAATREAVDAVRAEYEATEKVLRSRVWALRPALTQAVKTLREVYPNFEQHHEGGDIWAVIEAGERALVDTAGPTPRQNV